MRLLRLAAEHGRKDAGLAFLHAARKDLGDYRFYRLIDIHNAAGLEKQRLRNQGTITLEAFEDFLSWIEDAVDQILPGLNWLHGKKPLDWEVQPEDEPRRRPNKRKATPRGRQGNS